MSTALSGTSALHKALAAARIVSVAVATVDAAELLSRTAKGSGTIENMTALAWATFGLILATVGILAGALFTAINRSDTLGSRIDTLGSRIDTLGSDLRSEIRELRNEANGRFDAAHEDLREISCLRGRPRPQARRNRRVGVAHTAPPSDQPARTRRASQSRASGCTTPSTSGASSRLLVR